MRQPKKFFTNLFDDFDEVKHESSLTAGIMIRSNPWGFSLSRLVYASFLTKTLKAV